MYISEIAWRPPNPTYPKILILGESHYDKDINPGEANVHITRNIVDLIINDKVTDRWKNFFHNIAASFGYSKNRDGICDFYNKVYFANYVEESCETGSNNIADYLIWGKGDTPGKRAHYNKAVFEFCNEENISIICAFSKKAYHAFPPIDEINGGEVKKIPISANYTVGRTYYKKSISEYRDITLKNDLTLYGFNHASRSGYKRARRFISKEFKHHDILK